MKVKFNDETILNGASAVEQKIQRDGLGVGWTLTMLLSDEITAERLDSLLTADNISRISLMPDDATVDTQSESLGGTEYVLDGYDKIVSYCIRYIDGTSKPMAEIKLTKGV